MIPKETNWKMLDRFAVVVVSDLAGYLTEERCVRLAQNAYANRTDSTPRTIPGCVRSVIKECKYKLLSCCGMALVPS